MKRTRWIASEVGGRDDVIWIGDVGWGGGFSGGFARIQAMIYIWNGGIGRKKRSEENKRPCRARCANHHKSLRTVQMYEYVDGAGVAA